jgi:glyoxylase-like metal-dependent hydrolase (beta-lactamase superfamily II)
MRKSAFVLMMIAAAGLAAPGLAQQNAGDLEVVHVRGPVYLIGGAGSNITALVGFDGVLLVDTGSASMTDKVLATIRQLQRDVGARHEAVLSFGAQTRSRLDAERATSAPPKPIRFVINTSDDPDHTGGNEKIAAAGRTITGGNVAGDIRDASEGAAIYAHENVHLRMSGEGPSAAPSAAWPTDTYHTKFHKLSYRFNGEGVQLLHQPAVHTDGDTMVWFRDTDVLSVGDIFSTETYPVIDLERGGSVQGVIDGLNAILDLAFPDFRTEGGTMIVPGHGRLADSGDVAY